MIEITIQDFERQLPFAQTATTDLYDSVATGFEDSLNALQLAVLGPVEPDANANILQAVRAFVIIDTFLEKFHSRDIILTNNGFGIVSNQNLAPASKQRVDELKHELEWQRDRQRERLVNLLRVTEGWADSVQAETQIATLFWAPSLLTLFTGRGRARNTYADLTGHTQAITEADRFLRRMLSDELIDQLLDEERRATFHESHHIAIRKMQQVIGHAIDGADNWKMHYDRVATYIEKHIDDFPVYRNSSAYEANHAPTYENKQDDPSFFFA